MQQPDMAMNTIARVGRDSRTTRDVRTNATSRWRRRAVALAVVSLAGCGSQSASRPMQEPAGPGASAQASSQDVPPGRSAPAKVVLTPGERRVMTSDGVSLYVHVKGRGPVCLFVHGGPGQDSLSFEKMRGDALEAFVTMVYLDQRGSGKSPDASNYRLERVVQDFDEVRRALGVEKMCLIGHSFGGVLITAYARRYPDRVSALVMANATLQFSAPRVRLAQTQFIRELLGLKGEPLPPESDAAAVEATHEEAWRALMNSDKGFRVLADTWPTVRTMNEIESYPRSRGYGTAVMNGRATMPEYYDDYAQVSTQITQPVLVITSNRDYAVGPNEYKRFRFPQQKVVVLEGGHMAYYDASAGFTAAIRAFMAERE
jgi:proline iminopeptidase